MNFVLQRNRTISSVLGHSVEFLKGVPTHVPPELYEEVMAAGAEPEEPVERADEKIRKESNEPNDPTEREAALFGAYEKLALRNRRGDFTAGGSPTPEAIREIVGWKPDNKERDRTWAKFRVGGKDQ